MKKLISTLLATTLLAAASAQDLNMPQQGRSLFSNVGVSLNAGLTGFGATISTPLNKYLTARAGFGVLPYSYKYTEQTYFDLSPQLAQYGLSGLGIDPTLRYDIDLKGKLNVPAAHLLVDYSPFRQGRGAFHITAGLYLGGSNLIHVKGDANLADLQAKIDGARNMINSLQPGAGNLIDIDVRDFMFELGDYGVHLNDNGTANAYGKVNSVKPYLGIGWGHAIPTRRVGFRFDIGALYQGKPEITSANIDSDLRAEINSNETINKILDNARFYPQISFQLTFRLLKDR